VNGQEADDRGDEASSAQASQSPSYWQRTFLDKILPDVIKNLVTVLLVWLGAVITGYVKRPSATVLGTLVILAGGSAIVFVIIALQFPQRLRNPKVREYLGRSFSLLGVIVLLAAIAYTFPMRGQDPYWVLVTWAWAPAVLAFVMAEFVRTFLKEGSTRDAHQLQRLRDQIRSVGVVWMILAAAVWWVISRWRWGGASPLPAILLVSLGVLYLFRFHRLRWLNRRWTPFLDGITALVAASALGLLVAHIITGRIR